jgi:uncharacterized protein (DUF2336 family)
VHAPRSLIAEIENAIASGSSQRRVETLRRVTDLFMVSADDYSDEQVDVFDDVISRLADKIEIRARAELAHRLAPVQNAPATVVRTLARDEAIEVAGPVLTQSARLTDDDLAACAQGQDRLLAISKRETLSERVSDILVTHGDDEVVRSVAKNEGARFSHSGFGKLVERSERDDELAVSVGLRRDIPKEHFHALLSKASEAVFKKLAAGNPAAAAEVNRVLYDLTGVNAAARPKPQPRSRFDYSDAQQLFEIAQRSNQPIDLVVRDYAKASKFEETVVALATLCTLPTDVVENIMLDKRIDNDLVLILVKSSGLNWQTAKLILQFRAGEGGLSPQAIEKAYQHFERLQIATAKRVVRFYQVRQTANEKA